jgi:hypothetical protein
VHIFFSLSWLWVPIVLGAVFLQTWVRYKRTTYIKDQGGFLLELKLPKELMKSPAAMEVVIGAMAQPSVGSYKEVYFEGRVRPWFSLEIVSLGGHVHFFIWTQKKYRNFVESQIYSQFPSVEVHEVPDYALMTQYDKDVTKIWGTQLALTKADAFPIKTYIEYGLLDDPKEEFKIDPITPMIEFLGSLKPADQMWIQILIQAHKKENLKDLRLIEKPNWKKDVKNEIQKIIKEETLATPEEGKLPSMRDLSDIQKDVISAMQRNFGKPAFETMIRAIYIAPVDLYNSANVSGMTSIFKQFGSENMNGFKTGLITSFDYKYEDPFNRRLEGIKRRLFDAYRRRSFFYLPYRHYKGKPFILTAEELATIFHFPGGVAATPTLDRTPSRKAEPPSNLPI